MRLSHYAHRVLGRVQGLRHLLRQLARGRTHFVAGNVCEWKDCQGLAEFEVNAQWTVVDFISLECCLDHVEDMIAWLDQRTVDGMFPVDVWTRHFDLEVNR